MSVRWTARGYGWEVSLLTWVTVAALTALAFGVLVAPPMPGSDSVIYAVVIADLIAVGLIAGNPLGLWAAVALATCVCVAWYIKLFATDADSGILDGLVIALIVLVVASAAVGAGVLAGHRLR